MKTNQTSAGGIVIKKVPEGIKVLLIKDRFGRWTWPKGHLEQGETLEEAALREIEEETGISDLKIISEAGTQKYSFLEKGVEVDKIVQVFLVESKGDAVIKVQTEEISDAAWFSPGDALGKIEYEGSLDILNKALDRFRMKGD
jgi:8-oxo-dGTP pyrophosphatase MutT (NUDIX family)